MALDPKAFKAYDVRGVYPEELDEDGAYRIGRAYADVFEPAAIAVGRDMRLSSPSMSEAVVAGAADGGVDVVDIGMVGTEMLYFDDIVDAAERIWDLLDNYKEVVEGLEATNESVISHRQNYRLQLLTVVSVILLPLTLIASIFGMNVHFPGFGTQEAFWVVIGLTAFLGLGLLAIFHWRNWL